jgi:nitroreductase
MQKEFITYRHPLELTEEQMLNRSVEFLDLMKRRRTVRTFSSKEVSVEIIKNCINSAASSPSGANRQPWHFVVVSDPVLKKKIRIAAEAEEEEFYNSKAPIEWLDALLPLGTDKNKPFLEIAPYLIVIFEKKYEEGSNGKIVKNYYTKESVGIAAGVLITALHNAGLATLTHTPAPMDFLNLILDRPKNEKPFLILVTGLAEVNSSVPKISRKNPDEFLTFR